MPNWKSEIGRRLAGSKLEPARDAEIIEELEQRLEDLRTWGFRRGLHVALRRPEE